MDFHFHLHSRQVGQLENLLLIVDHGARPDLTVGIPKTLLGVNEDAVGGGPDDTLAELILDAVTEIEREELHRRELSYRGGRPAPEVQGRTVILIDDGLATGATMRAAVAALRQRRAAKIVVAVPVGAPSTCHDLAKQVDETICAITPSSFIGVGQYYEDFSQTTDDEVRDLLARAAAGES